MKLPAGLVHMPRFVNAVQRDALVASCLALRRSIVGAVALAHDGAAAVLHQPIEHALPGSTAVRVKDDDGHWPWPLDFEPLLPLDCEHWAAEAADGLDGHELAHFRGNSLPLVVSKSVVKLASTRVAAVVDLGRPAELDWTLSLNTYRRAEAEAAPPAAGLPLDIATGTSPAVTMILGLHAGATVQLEHKDEAGTEMTVEVEPGELLVLADEALHDWRHSLLPAVAETTESNADQGASGGQKKTKCLDDDIRAVSLILGVR